MGSVSLLLVSCYNHLILYTAQQHGCLFTNERARDYYNEKHQSVWWEISLSLPPVCVLLSLPVLLLKGNLCGMCFVNLSWHFPVFLCCVRLLLVQSVKPKESGQPKHLNLWNLSLSSLNKAKKGTNSSYTFVWMRLLMLAAVSSLQ